MVEKQAEPVTRKLLFPHTLPGTLVVKTAASGGAHEVIAVEVAAARGG